MEEVRWKMEEVRWKMEEVRWKMEEVRWKMEEVRWKMEEGGLQTSDIRHLPSHVMQTILCYVLERGPRFGYQ
jgi:hypothetical protein